MSGSQISIVAFLLVLTAAIAWWLGRRGRVVTQVPVVSEAMPVPEEISNKEELLHHRLAKAAAEMVVPLETFFSCGVELNLKTASLTKELLANLPAKEAATLLALQSGLDKEGLNRLSEQSGFSLPQLEQLRLKFAAQTAAALLPKIKSGLSSEPEVKPVAAPGNPKVSAMTERLTLSTESAEVTSLRQKYEDAKQQIQQLTATHVPKSRLDRLQEEHSQQRQVQIQMARSIEELQAQLQSAQAEIAALPVAELDQLRRQVSGQQDMVGQLESALSGLQTSLASAQEDASKLSLVQESEASLQARCTALEAELNAAKESLQANDQTAALQEAQTRVAELEGKISQLEKSHIPLKQLENLQMEFATKHEAHSALVTRHDELHRELMEAKAVLAEPDLSEEVNAAKQEAEAARQLADSLRNQLEAMAGSHLPKAEVAALESQLALRLEEHAALASRLEELEYELLAARESAATAVTPETLAAAQAALAMSQERLDELETKLAETAQTHVPKDQLANLQMEFAAKHEAHAALSARLEEMERELAEARELAASGASSEELAATKSDLAASQALLQELETKLAATSQTHVPKDQLANLQVEFAAKHEAHAALSARLEEMDRELAEARELAASGASTEELAAVKSDLAASQALLQELETKLEETSQTHVPKQDVLALHAEVKSAQEALAAQVARVEEMETELRFTREAAAAVADMIPKSHLENLQMEFASKHEANANLVQRQEELESELASLREELDESNEALATALKQRGSTEQLTEDLELAEIEAREAREAAARIEEDLEAAQARLLAIEESRSSSEEELEMLREELAQATSRAAQLEEELAEVRNQSNSSEDGEQEAAALGERIAELELALEEAQSAQVAGKATGEEVELLCEELAQASSRVSELENELQELSALREQIATADEEMAALRAALGEAQAQPVSPSDEAYADLEQELKILRESQSRVLAELETLREAHAAIPTDQIDLAERHAALEAELQANETVRATLVTAVETAKEEIAKLKTEMEAQRQGTVLRSDYESLRNEMDKARNDLSTALSRYANLQQRFNSIDKAASIEKLKAALAQEEKAHGVMRIQYRNLESRLYEAVGGRKRVETDLKAITKERDELMTKLRAVEKSSVSRVKVTLPPEVANPTLPEDAGSEEIEAPAPKRKAVRKKAAKVDAAEEGMNPEANPEVAPEAESTESPESDEPSEA